MEEQVPQMKDKVVKVSYETWHQLKGNAFYNYTNIKTIVDDVINGKRDPKTGKPIE
jgi:hypothetical protein